VNSYDRTQRVFKIDDPPDMLLKYVDANGHIPEIYWGSLKYCYETTRDRSVGLALRDFQETLKTCGIPPVGWDTHWELHEIPAETPTGTVLRPYQIKAVQRMAQGSMILGDGMGLGKTLSALWTWWNLGGMYLGQRNLTIITPSDDVADEWRRAAIQHLGFRGLVTVRDRGDLEEAKFAPALAIPYHRFWRTDYLTLLQARLAHHSEDRHPILVLDEAHRISRTTSQQHSHIWQAVRDNPRALVWALSGTEVSNTPDGYYGLYRIITRSQLPEIAWKDFVQDVWTKQWKENRLKQIKVLRRGFALRRTVDDVGMELPPLTEITCLVDMHPVQRDIYNEVRRDQTLTVVKDGQEQCTSITHFWTANIRLTQVASHPLLVNDDRIVGATPKFDRLVDIIQDSDKLDKVIIWSNFPRVIEWIATELRARFPGYRVVTASGQVSKDDRQLAKDSFQAGEVDILVANPAVWSEGVNLIPGRTMIYWDYSASRVQWEQSRKRSHRMGQTRPVTIYKLVTRDSIEQKWCRWLLRKATLADLISGK